MGGGGFPSCQLYVRRSSWPLPARHQSPIRTCDSMVTLASHHHPALLLVPVSRTRGTWGRRGSGFRSRISDLPQLKKGAEPIFFLFSPNGIPELQLEDPPKPIIMHSYAMTTDESADCQCLSNSCRLRGDKTSPALRPCSGPLAAFAPRHWELLDSGLSQHVRCASTT